ncbi:MAG: leucyl aminopeptidase family protein, partial [Psychrobium sp.]|nr:leucyl aminopeptidase family protein [Psychrobium sp.]
MKHLINAKNQGTPLIVLDKTEFSHWLNEQPAQVKNWLMQTSYSGEGLSLIPTTTGELAQAIFVVKDLAHYFSCGDLIKSLPVTQYNLVCAPKFEEAIC